MAVVAFVFDGGKLTRQVDGHGFASFRGALLNDARLLVFYATPVSGRLAIFCGPDPAAHRIFGIGDPLLGSSVAEFALNPVSANNLGQLAVRVLLEDGRQAIVSIQISC